MPFVFGLYALKNRWGKKQFLEPFRVLAGQSIADGTFYCSCLIERFMESTLWMILIW